MSDLEIRIFQERPRGWTAQLPGFEVAQIKACSFPRVKLPQGQPGTEKTKIVQGGEM